MLHTSSTAFPDTFSPSASHFNRKTCFPRYLEWGSKGKTWALRQVENTQKNGQGRLLFVKACLKILILPKANLSLFLQPILYELLWDCYFILKPQAYALEALNSRNCFILGKKKIIQKHELFIVTIDGPEVRTLLEPLRDKCCLSSEETISYQHTPCNLL